MATTSFDLQAAFQAAPILANTVADGSIFSLAPFQAEPILNLNQVMPGDAYSYDLRSRLSQTVFSNSLTTVNNFDLAGNRTSIVTS